MTLDYSYAASHMNLIGFDSVVQCIVYVYLKLRSLLFVLTSQMAAVLSMEQVHTF